MKYHTTGAENYLAGVLCATGLFLHIILPDPLLNSLGFHYSGEYGEFYEKIHPGTFLIFISLFTLLLRDGKPFTQLFSIYRQNQAFLILLLVCSLSFIYMALRGGINGLAFIIETHINAAICAVVLSHAPAVLCRRIVNMLVITALINGITGIIESLGKFRIFEFDEQWPVLHEQYFRASAFIGHPLDNATFTAIILFVALSSCYSELKKSFITFILVASLAAFGGRAALVCSVAGLLTLGIYYLWKKLTDRQITLTQLFLILGTGLAIPLCLAAIIYLAIDSGIGERIAESIQWDSSADTRRLAFTAFSYMADAELWLGVSPERIMDIVYRMNLDMPLADIENPWIIMLMGLGLAVFPFWLAATTGFLCSLVKNKPFAFKIVVLVYIAIATTYNSFGRKDANYAIMAGAVICAARLVTFKSSTSSCK